MNDELRWNGRGALSPCSPVFLRETGDQGDEGDLDPSDPDESASDPEALETDDFRGGSGSGLGR